MTEAGPEELLRDLQAGRERLLGVVSGVGEAQFKRRPEPSDAAGRAGWCIAEVLAHLLASEQRAATRVEALLAGDAGPEPVPEAERAEEARQGRASPVPQLIHGLLAARRALERSLTAQGRGALPAGVRATVREDVIEHEAEHTAQIEGIRAALGS